MGHYLSKQNLYVPFAFLLGLLLRFIMGLQGVDEHDTGYCMTYYQNFFSNPDTMTFYHNFYLTGLVGGLWELVFGRYGLLGFRVLELMVQAIGILLIYLSFKPWAKPDSKLTSISIFVSFLFPTCYITFYYNTFTFLILAINVFFMSKWSYTGKSAYLFVAGLFVGVSFFVRSVNMVLSVLVAVPFLRGYQISLRKGLLYVCQMLVGVLLGISLMLEIVLVLGHWRYFFDGIREAFSTLGAEEASHSSSNLMLVYLKSAVNIGIHIVVILTVSVLFFIAQKFSKNKMYWICGMDILAVAAFILTNRPYTAALAVTTILLLLSCSHSWRQHWFSQPPSSNFVFLSTYALFAAYVVPLGSDTGIESIFNKCGAMLLTIPAMATAQWISEKWKRILAGALCFFICVGLIVRMGKSATGEHCSRLEATTMILPPTLNVMSGHDKAMCYRNVVRRVSELGEPYPMMILANQAAELYYATGKIPFTGNTMIGAYQGTALLSQLDRRLIQYHQPPMVVYVRQDENRDIVKNFRETLEIWMQRLGYSLSYKDEDVRIYTPNTSNHNE